MSCKRNNSLPLGALLLDVPEVVAALAAAVAAPVMVADERDLTDLN